MILSEQDHGRTVNVRTGSLIAVRLIENPTTGYRWIVESVGGLDPVGDRFEAGVAIGAAGVRVFEFRATRPGTQVICLKNVHAWEGADSAVAQFEATVVVT